MNEENRKTKSSEALPISNGMEKIVSLAKRRGFVFQGSEIYGGLAGMWDYGPYGLALKNNIKNLWWKTFVDDRDDVYGIDAAILMNEKVWEASGHTGAGFADMFKKCNKCGAQFRTDQLPDNIIQPDGSEPCPYCGTDLSPEFTFNLMFKTKVGVLGEAESYLRPETAQGIFVNFKNIVDSIHPKLPFGIAQAGRAFRNEIAPRDFVFRAREFEQMEVEYFIKESEWKKYFEEWKQTMFHWMKSIGLDMQKIHELEVPEEDRAHYSKRTIDFEFDFPFGRKELYGLAYRTNFDLKNHGEHSSVDMSYIDETTGEKLIPHVIEPSLGVDRTVLAVLVSAYREDEMGGEQRTYLAFDSAIAPIKAAVFPLLKNKPELVEKARSVYDNLKKQIPHIMWDDNGNIGKRYRRQDEIGTPHCVTIDFDTLKNDTVTVRDRDSGKQKRVSLKELSETLTPQA